jgi:hypothetical protein
MSTQPESLGDTIPVKTTGVTDPTVFRQGTPWRIVTDLNDQCLRPHDHSLLRILQD